MDIQLLSTFFMWCCIINGGVFVVWTIFLILTPGLVFRFQGALFNISRDTFDVVIYAFLGAFKLLFLVFNVTPYVALLVMGN